MDLQKVHISDRIRELRKDGESLDDIQRILGCSRDTISRYLASLDNIGDKGRHIISLGESGLRFNDIKRITGYSKSTIGKWLQFVERPIPDKYQHKAVVSETPIESKDPRIAAIKLNRRARIKVIRPWIRGLKLRDGCMRCRYRLCTRSLHLHHIDAELKCFELSKTSIRSLQAIVDEIKKCIVLCANCHGEYHDGLWTEQNLLPIDIGSIPQDVIDAFTDRKAVVLSDEVLDKEKLWIHDRMIKREILPAVEEDINFDCLRILNISPDATAEFLNKYHYLGYSRKGYLRNYGLFNGDNLIGAAIITNSIRQRPSDVCELSRFALSVRCKNLASKFLSMIIRDLKRTIKYKTLQTFAQSDIHSGTIYKACGFKKLGTPSDTYNYNGIHKKTIYERAMAFGLTEDKYAEIFGLSKIPEAGKIRFEIDLK